MAKRKPAATFSVSVDKEQLQDVGKCCGSCRKPSDHACSGGIYFLGFVGAAIYYISIATGFWNGALGVLKAAVWPAFLVFELFKYLQM